EGAAATRAEPRTIPTIRFMRSPYLRVSIVCDRGGCRLAKTGRRNARGCCPTTASARRGCYQDVKLGTFGESGNSRQPSPFVKITILGEMKRINPPFCRAGHFP